MEQELELEQIRQQQKESWNRFSPGLKKWDNLFMDFLKPMGNEIIRMIHSKKNKIVLDVAAGTGEPGLTIATILNGGKVVITDLAEDMLGIARENAKRRGITNFETYACDVCELPFADNIFDAISCRFGFMFFPDMLLAAREMVRVMKPGAKIAASVWNIPERNFWITAIIEAIQKHVDMQLFPSEVPGMFRCAEDGFISNLFAEAGLRNIVVKEITSKMNCQTSATYWTVMTEVVVPVITSISHLDNTTKERIRRDVEKHLHQRYPNGNIQVEASALVICGEK